MYMRRRRPDSLEVQQMKEQKREEARQKAREREALKREIRAREEMEKSREGKQKIRDFTKKMSYCCSAKTISIIIN